MRTKLLIILFLTFSFIVVFAIFSFFYPTQKPVKIRAKVLETSLQKSEASTLLRKQLAANLRSNKILGTETPLEVNKEGPKEKTEFSFNAIAPSWEAETPIGTEVVFQIRTSRDGKNWDDWKTIEEDEDGNAKDGESSNRKFGNLIVSQGNFIQDRIVIKTADLEIVPSVEDLKLTYIDSKERLNPLEKLLKKIRLNIKEVSASYLDNPTQGPPICSRACWGADESLKTWDSYYSPIKKMIVHHTATTNNDPDPAATMRAIYHFHAVDRGWGDIGYNFVIDPKQGTIYEGRSGGDAVIGAHVAGYNTGSVGVAVLGDFRSTFPGKRVQNNLHKLAVWKLYAHDVNPDDVSVFGSPGTNLPSIFVHGSVANTSCAGTNLSSFVPSLIPWSHYMPQQILLTTSSGTKKIFGSDDQTVDDLLSSYANQGSVSPNYLRLINKPYLGDFNGDGIPNAAVWNPINGKWYIKDVGIFQYGAYGDIPVPGDYDGDGTIDLAVWRPVSGEWHIKNIGVTQYGGFGDIPVPADYFGGNGTDIAVWRPASGEWHIKDQGITNYGIGEDVPVPGDYFGDTKDDIAIWRPQNGEWHIRNYQTVQYGAIRDVPVPMDYVGDTKDDIAIWRPQNGEWHIQNSVPLQYGGQSDKAIPGNFFDDQKSDIAIWRAFNGEWHIRNYTVIPDVTK